MEIPRWRVGLTRQPLGPPAKSIPEPIFRRFLRPETLATRPAGR